mmetsp:Transcript_23676/g.33936  ORF Transcript_23676/g.33936 Transcript_23676/m.33936 type:complete len:107 (+) Transcript_23676:374-694(+)
MSCLRERTMYSIAWTLLLIFIVWPLSYFCVTWWMFLLPFEPHFDCIHDVELFLENIMRWPKKVGRAIQESSCHFPGPGPDPLETFVSSNPCLGAPLSTDQKISTCF